MKAVATVIANRVNATEGEYSRISQGGNVRNIVDNFKNKIIKEIEESLPNVKFYKTNLVKCLPLNEKGKLRYPTKEECLTCLDNLLREIKELQPKVIVLLGKKVSSYVLKRKEQIDVSFIHALHPSYIYVYKRNSILEYEKNLKQEIEKYL